MPKLRIDTSKISDQSVVDALESVQDHADSNVFMGLDGKIIKFLVQTTTSSESIVLFHGLGYTPNIAFPVGIIGQDYVGTTFSPVVSSSDTNDKTLKVVVSMPCYTEMIMFVGRDAERKKL